MSTLLGSLMNLITPDTLSKISSSLGEENKNVKTAVDSTVASLFGSILSKGSSAPGLESILKGAASSSILSNVTSLFSGGQDEATKKLGTDFASSLLGGNKISAFTQMISSHSGISLSSSEKLFGMLTPLVPAFLGSKMKAGGLDIKGLVNQLFTEKSSFSSLLPSGLTNFLGGVDVSNIPNPLKNTMNSLKTDIKPKGGMPWLKWAIPLAVIAAGAFWWLDSGKAKDAVKDTQIEATKAVDTIEEKTDDALAAATSEVHSIVATGKEMIDIKLPDGVAIRGFKDGSEERMLTFLKDSDYKNLSEAELKDKWFDFDNINFEFGSSTKLTPESEQQLKNIATILSHYPDSKIKLGAYTDKKGDEAVNLKISQERANTIKNELIKLGVPEMQVVSAEGYGSEFATVSADATDEERAKDRRIAFRFEK